MKYFSWACPKLLDKKGERKSGGCGGNWGPVVPEHCPTCGGQLDLLQELRAEQL